MLSHLHFLGSFIAFDIQESRHVFSPGKTEWLLCFCDSNQRTAPQKLFWNPGNLKNQAWNLDASPATWWAALTSSGSTNTSSLVLAGSSFFTLNFFRTFFSAEKTTTTIGDNQRLKTFDRVGCRTTFDRCKAQHFDAADMVNTGRIFQMLLARSPGFSPKLLRYFR